MRQQAGLTQHQFAHGFQIVKRRAIAEFAQGFAHLGKNQFRFVAEGKQSLGATECFAFARDLENFVGRHRVGARLARIAAKGAISAIIAAEISERNKNFARIGDHAGAEMVASLAGQGEQLGQIFIRANDPAVSFFSRNGGRQRIRGCWTLAKCGDAHALGALNSSSAANSKNFRLEWKNDKGRAIPPEIERSWYKSDSE